MLPRLQYTLASCPATPLVFCDWAWVVRTTQPRESLALTIQPYRPRRYIVVKGVDFNVADLLLNVPSFMGTHREEGHHRAAILALVRVGIHHVISFFPNVINIAMMLL